MLQDIAIAHRRPGGLRGGRPQARDRRSRPARHAPARSSSRRTTRRSSREPAPRTRSRAGSPRSRPRSRTPTRTGTARSSRSVSRSSPAASRSSRSAQRPRSSSRRRSTGSRTPCRATRAAIEEGIVPGGGVTLIRAEAALGQARSGRRRGDGRQDRADALAEPARRHRRATPATRAPSIVAAHPQRGRRAGLRRRRPASGSTWSRRASSTRPRSRARRCRTRHRSRRSCSRPRRRRREARGREERSSRRRRPRPHALSVDTTLVAPREGPGDRPLGAPAAFRRVDVRDRPPRRSALDDADCREGR